MRKTSTDTHLHMWETESGLTVNWWPRLKQVSIDIDPEMYDNVSLEQAIACDESEIDDLIETLKDVKATMQKERQSNEKS